jgi:hypothetical protein
LSGNLSGGSEFKAYAPHGEVREVVIDEPVGSEAVTTAAAPSTFDASDDAADFRAEVDGWQEAPSAPSELLSDSASPAQPQHAQVNLGSMVDMAALPAIPQNLEPVGDTAAPDATLAAVLADALQPDAPESDIDALLDALPAGGASDMLQSAGTTAMTGEPMFTDWSGGMSIQQIFDAAGAGQDAMPATQHA